MTNCVFCQKDIWNANVYETENFRVRVGLGIVTPGHCMIIPKKHYKCIADMPGKLEEEYLKLKQKVYDKVLKGESEPFLVEYGVFGQSVPHAHVHFIPRFSQGYSEVNAIEEIVLPACAENNLVLEQTDFIGLRRIYKEDGVYVSFEQSGQLYVVRIKDLSCSKTETHLSYRNFLTDNKGLKGITDWQKTTPEEQRLDEIRREKTRNMLTFSTS